MLWPLMLLTLGGLILGLTTRLMWGLTHPRRKTYAVAMARGLPTSPEDMGLTGHEHVFTMADGSEAPGFVVEGRDPQGPVVFITHGFGDSRFGSLTWVPHVSPHARRVVVYDNRAAGDHTAGHGTAGTREPEDLLAVIEQAAPREPVVLMGYSMGAVISIGAADRLRALGDDAPAPLAGLILDGAYRFRMQPVAAHLWLARLPPYPAVWLADAIMRVWLGGERAFDRLPMVQRLDVPMLFLHGANDPKCEFIVARRMADRSPRATFVAFPEGAHCNLWQVDVEAYHAALADFFAQLKLQPPA